MKVLLLIFTFYVSSIKSEFLTVNYYHALIRSGMIKALLNKLPTKNAEFVKGFQSQEIINIGSFDFIIIGAGSGGSVLATRLSEIPDWNILLLEAGGEENDFNEIPGMFYYCQFTDVNWGYYTTPQTNSCLGMRDKKCMVPRGKVVGGTSTISHLFYVRGNKKDFDYWVELGNPGWSYNDVLPYFIKSENSQIDGDPGYHGKGGLWNVQYYELLSDIGQHFIDANKELNTPYRDYNGESEIGVSKLQANTKHGRRQSLGRAFLATSRERKNLKFISRALVTKIIIDPKLKTAVGVEFVTKHKKYQANAKIEVLLSAGAINSPQLLMMSGVGPEKELKKHNIKQILDLPGVGENLLNQPMYIGTAYQTNYTRPSYDLREEINQYLNGRGILSTTASVQAMDFINTSNSSEGVPTVAHVVVPTNNINNLIYAKVLNLNLKAILKYLIQLAYSNTVVITTTLLLHPKSRGRITLKSNKPTDFPNIEPHIFSEPEDIETMTKGLQYAEKLFTTKPFQKIKATPIDIKICGEFEKGSKKYYECAIRHLAIVNDHPGGTTAMGPNATSSVVDSNLKVHGIKQLRVVDAGVFPSTLSGHPNAVIVMIAEKISDAIKREYNKPT